MGSTGSGLAILAAVTGGDHLQLVTQVQVVLSLLAAMFLFYFGLCQLGILKQPQWMQLASPERVPGYRRIIRLAFVNQRTLEMFLTGLLMGLLPCGLSYAAFARAIAAGTPLQGSLMLLAFGVGTLPGLLLIGTGATTLARRYQRHFDIVSGLLMMAMGLSLSIKVLSSI
jgi:sulfite exporter TauE/SafE